MKPLTKKEILKRHKQNSIDKELHKIIETKEVKRSDFNRLIQQSTKHHKIPPPHPKSWGLGVPQKNPVQNSSVNEWG